MMIQTPPCFVPQQYCLTCQGCCRFHEARSVWRPKVLMNEMKKKVFQSRIDRDCFLTVKKKRNSFLCCFLDDQVYRCQIYRQRPFECRLYPFLLVYQDNQTLLAVHLACPFVQENRSNTLLSDQIKALKNFFRDLKREDYAYDKRQESFFSKQDMAEMDILCAL